MIKWAFLDPKSPACFSTATNVLGVVRQKWPKISRRTVEDILMRIPAYSLHKARRVKFARRRTIPSGYMHSVQVDLADMQKIANANSGMNYILVGVDVMSRQLYAVPTKSKSSPHMIAAFKRLFSTMPCKPMVIYSDKGLEFQAGEVRKFFKDSGIDKHVADSPDVKAAIAERFIRTLKGRLYKYFTINETTRWLEVLPAICSAINNTYSKAIGMRPNQVNFKNAEDLWMKWYGQDYLNKNLKKGVDSANFRVGDSVRIAKYKTPFAKAYLPNYSAEVYRVARAITAVPSPHVYELETAGDGGFEKVRGKFYNQELSQTRYNLDKALVIERVLKTRFRRGIKEYFVAFREHPDTAATWITENDLEK